MKIIQFTAENIKKLKVVTIKPDGSLVQITGPNGAGKSSVLDSIFYALGGTADLPSQPVRKGAGKGHITLDLGDLKVTRRFVENGGTSLVVEAANGARFPSPQGMLDELMGKLAFDPLAFTRMKPADQLATLRGLVKIDADLEALDLANKADFERRAECNRNAKRLTAQIAGMMIPEGLPEKPEDISALTTKLASAAETNAFIHDQKRLRQNQANDVAENLKQAKDKRDEAASLIKQAEALEINAKELSRDLLNARPLDELIDTAELAQQIERARKINDAITKRDERRQLNSDLTDAEKESEELTEAMKARVQQKTDAIAKAAMPVDGLSFGEGEVIYNGIPMAQASDAEQLRVSIAIAMAANPKLRVLRIRDGSLLDENSLKVVGEMADKADYQVWIERVDTTGKVGIVMEDGAVIEHKEEKSDVEHIIKSKGSKKAKQ